MKNTFITLCCISLLALSATTASALMKKVEVTNGTEIELYTIKVSPADQNNWGDNLLKSGPLSKGSKVTLDINRPEDAPSWDINATDSSGNQINWVKIDLSNEGTVTLLPDGKYTK